MANINLKSNLSRTIVPDSLTTSVLFDIAFDNGFQKISEYLSEDAEDVEDSTKLQTEAIIKSISERATCNNQTLVSLMTFLKFIYEYDNKLAKVVPIRKYDRHADRGMEFLFAVFGDNIGSEIDKLRSKSKLREDSNFSLVTIIASYILKRINLRLINSNFETFELFELLKNYSKPLEVEVVSAEKIQNHSSRSKSKTKSIAFVILALLIPAAILIFYFLDFWGGVSSRGQVSKVSFSTFASAEFEKLSPISVASKSFVNRLITSVTNYFQKDDEATGTKIASIVGIVLKI